MSSSAGGKVAFITGGASGIGAALAAKLVEAGAADVWIADRQFAAAEEVAERLNRAGGSAHAVELDVRDYPSFQRAVAEAVRQSGRIDYLFNNAGIGIGGEVDSLSPEDWNDAIDVNLRGVIHGIQAAYPIMVRQHSGCIVNTASMAGLFTTVGQAPYTTTKHAVVALSRALRIEARHHGVQVSVLCPGVVRTPILTGGEYGRHKGVSKEDLLKLGEALRPMAAEVFAERALRAVFRDRAIIVLPARWKALWYLERFAPPVSSWAGALMLKRQREVAASGPGSP